MGKKVERLCGETEGREGDIIKRRSGLWLEVLLSRYNGGWKRSRGIHDPVSFD